MHITVGAQEPLRGVLSVHDPSRIIKCKDQYYVFCSHNGISWRSSADKRFWAAGGSVFYTQPGWTTNFAPDLNGFWAPDIVYVNGRYHLYYSVSSWGSQVSAIGLATNPTLDPIDPAYQWTDLGP
ncbi:MAG: family 43 glycosylhydrolase, partial [Verrucomicrobiae bacterium]|nr:family 43 glycosylhydrolase [Verrucomicrobiae bacterium]